MNQTNKPLVQDNKPVVHYIGEAFVLDNRAYLTPVDHPNHLPSHSISNNESVITSTVLSHNKETGKIETMNTIYIPLRIIHEHLPK